MPNRDRSSSDSFIISKVQQQQTIEQIGCLLKERLSLQQSLADRVATHTASNEQLFLEILELFDTLESLIDYLQNNPQLTQQAIERIPKSLNTIQSKLLATLARRQVERVEITDPSDLQFCQIVDTQSDAAVTVPRISKIVRQGFTIDKRLLRPVEVIVQKPPVSN
jgi:molecular chaperone GrpE